MNRQYFNEAAVKAGELDAFLAALRSQDYGKGRQYNDVHAFPADCGAYIVEWEQRMWDGDEDQGFIYIDSEHAVVLEREMPDGTFEQFFDEDDYKMVLNDWLADELKAGREWKKDGFGHWIKTTKEKEG